MFASGRERRPSGQGSIRTHGGAKRLTKGALLAQQMLVTGTDAEQAMADALVSVSDQLLSTNSSQAYAQILSWLMVEFLEVLLVNRGNLPCKILYVVFHIVTHNDMYVFFRSDTLDSTKIFDNFVRNNRESVGVI